MRSSATSPAFWDAMFAEPDPWSYGDGYERTKRAHTREVIRDLRPRTILEIGCAEGHFTAELATVADRVFAVDLSSVALERAHQRCAHLDNVTFAHANAFEAVPGGPFDLIVCSEVLYYCKNRFALRRIVRRLVSHLNPAGHLLLTHVNSVTDQRDRTGLDFHEIGSAFIGACAAGIRGLQLIRELQTELYRVQLFQRQADETTPLRWTRQADVGDGDRVFGLVKWGGCDVTDAESRHLWKSPEIPILMYHRIADAGPAALAPYRVRPEEFERQLGYLRRNGYRSVTIDAAHTALQEGDAPAGRLVSFTFDDAYRDFFDTAWPLLKAHGFVATVFVPVAFVGGHAEWDRSHGEPAEIMSWEQIKAAQREGVVFGSHALSHRRLGSLSQTDAHEELLRSKVALETALEAPLQLLSYPFGDANPMVCRTAQECGYRYGVVGGGRASRADHRYQLPRQEVLGAYGLDQFVALLGTPQRASWDKRLRYQWRHLVRDRRTYMQS